MVGLLSTEILQRKVESAATPKIPTEKGSGDRNLQYEIKVRNMARTRHPGAGGDGAVVESTAGSPRGPG